MQLIGTLKKIIYKNDGFAIMLIRSQARDIKAKGLIVNPRIGMQYALKGESETHPVYGESFSFFDYKIELPTDISAIQSYLIENIKGIGPVAARRITDKLGKETLEVCRKDPYAVTSARGVSRSKSLLIHNVLVANSATESMMIELKKMFANTRISRRSINDIVKKYKNESAEKIKGDPYRLTEFHGIGFLRADAVALNLKFDMESAFRIEAGLFYLLEEAAKSHGHTYLEADLLIARACEMLQVAFEKVNHAYRNISTKKLYRDTKDSVERVALPIYAMSEKAIAEKIILMQNAFVLPPTKTVDLEGLTEGQREAVGRAINNQVFILTGAPGTGKTYTVRKLIAAFSPCLFALCAPTGKAAQRISELTGQPASTIHRLLGAQMRDGKFSFAFNKKNPLPHNPIIVDETSMVDVPLFHSLISAIRKDAKLILVGDTNQLPPVGPGNILKDMLLHGIPHVELTEIVRQNPGLIVTNCHQIKAGKSIKYTNKSDTDFFVRGISDIDAIKAEIVGLFKNGRLQRQFGTALNLFRDVQVLSPVREKTELSCAALNAALQKTLNSKSPEKGEKFWVGDKVIQTKNDYRNDIMNGDIGRVVAFEFKQIVVKFQNPYRKVRLPAGANKLRLAYALTVHKYQGSECPIIIIPIHRCFGPLIMQRNWLYTAISRAQKAVIIVGQIGEIERIIARNQQTKRLTLLEDFLNGK